MLYEVITDADVEIIAGDFINLQLRAGGILAKDGIGRIGACAEHDAAGVERAIHCRRNLRRGRRLHGRFRCIVLLGRYRRRRDRRSRITSYNVCYTKLLRMFVTVADRFSPCGLFEL